MTFATADIDWTSAGNRWLRHVQYLASDELAGRGTGSAGYLKAAAYVARQFQEAGLAGTGTDGYFQDVAFDVKQIDEACSSLALVHPNDNFEPLILGEDATLRVRSKAGSSIELGAVFVGYGFAVPEMNFDELAGLDLEGKIAVYITGGPAGLSETFKSHYQSVAERHGRLLRAGAAGIATIPNPKVLEIPWARLALGRLHPEMDLSDSAVAESQGMMLSIMVNAEHADKLFAGSGHTIAGLLAKAEAGESLPKFPLAIRIRASVAVKEWQVHSPNVIGSLPGSDADLASEYVVISAHLDHLGVAQSDSAGGVSGQPGDPAVARLPNNCENVPKIFSGAMDNAAGVASLIEIARWFHETDVRPKRSLIFLAITGEEHGQLGSAYFCAHPTVELHRIVANVNMDMYLPLFPLKYLQVQGLDESTLGEDVREVCSANGVEAQSDLDPAANRFIRSDQYSFVKKGIPALAFKFGYLSGTPENKIYHDFVHSHYHAVSDKADNPDINPVAAAQFSQIVARLALRVANRLPRPAWNRESFYRRFASGSWSAVGNPTT